MIKRNTIQKELVLNAVLSMHRHVTADDVYEFIHRDHPSVGKGTVYRNLRLLADEQKIRAIEIPNGADYFDFTVAKHYHIRCIDCGEVFDVDMDAITDLQSQIRDKHEIIFLDYEILFKGICVKCQKKRSE